VERDTANSAAREAVKTAVGVGSVFINYRSVDDPLGAALIHDRLAARFGQNKVFRDTASLTPSMHYPSAIQSAVRNAAVLIAVIGPRWLTLTDERAVRLIDREDDWVRRELAMAFANEVAVLPVLLKDTPTDAVMPTGAELPEDIRPLATLQAVEISQRRLSADLERLVTAITRIGHLPETPTVSQTPAIFFAIVETLEQISSLRTDHDRAIVISQLPPAVANSVAYSARRRAHVINLLTACLDHPDGITSLLDVIRSVEEAWHHELLRLAELAAQLPSRT